MPRKAIQWSAAVMLAALATGAGAAPKPPAAACGETCLKGYLDRYVAALTAHDAGRLPFAKTVRATENGALVPPGDGIWNTFTGAGPYRHDVYDVASGGVGTFMSMTENDDAGLISIRLKVRAGKIAEVETVVSRSNRNAAAMARIDPSWMSAWDQEEPAATRLTRAQLIAGVLGYMRAVAFHDGKLAPFADDCLRVENGGVTAIGPEDKAHPPVPLPAPPANGPDTRVACAKQLDDLMMSFIQGFESAHFPVVDVKRQIVFGAFDFMRRGNVKAYVLDGKTIPISTMARYPNEGVNAEAWKFKDGKIWRVEAVFPGIQAYRHTTGWPGTKPLLRPITDTAGGRLILQDYPNAKR